MNSMDSSIRYIKGIGEKKAGLFSKLGIFTVGDLLSYYPRDYEDWNNTVTAVDAPDNEACCIKATLATAVSEHRIRKGMTLYKCNFTDGETIIKVTLFNNKFLASSLRIYDEYLLFGKVEKTFTYVNMSSPRIEKAVTGERIRPVYPAINGLNSRAIEKSVQGAIDSGMVIDEFMPTDIIEKYNLISHDAAVKQIHFPQDESLLEMAKNRLIFQELLILMLALLKMKSKGKSQTRIKLARDYSDDFFNLLPFTPTNAQKRVIGECIADMGSDMPMNRLVQGDVGSGKTAVAAGVIYSTVKNGYQCAMMAPTEILAAQHYETLSKLLSTSNITLQLLTGSVTAAAKRKIKERLAQGEIDLIIGTHALIQNDVEFKNLGLVVTDEQHRFGVKQRTALAEKGADPHMLVMSATPIPRTLAMIIYGDLDISVIDEMPAGRQEIDTFPVDSSYHTRIYNFIKKAVNSGYQAYIVCPLVEEGESDLKPAVQYAQQLESTAFQGYKLGLLHGKMKAKEKEKVMTAFSNNEIQILVSTTVIEVGVDVPNAVIMLVEDADRFGLSQLHQLRGRVGRGKHKSYCILVSDNKSRQSKTRMEIMHSTNNGFVIADEDLKLRGPGDFFGHRQHGLPNLKIADMAKDMDVLRSAQQCAKDILNDDFKLDREENRGLCKQVLALLDNMRN